METIAQHDLCTVLHDPCNSLPFVKEITGRRRNWVVEETGDYERDFETGRRFARRLVSAIRNRSVSPFFLSYVIQDMPAEKGAIEQAFISEIGCVLVA